MLIFENEVSMCIYSVDNTNIIFNWQRFLGGSMIVNLNSGKYVIISYKTDIMKST